MALGDFAGYADFLILDQNGRYCVWDTKLARSPKPYYAVQLCCYSEMLAAAQGGSVPDTFGIILGSKEEVEFRTEDFIHLYHRIKAAFLDMQQAFTGNLKDCPEPLPSADHGRWTSHAEKFFRDTDHLVQVAGITVGQIKRLKNVGIATLSDLAESSGTTVPKLTPDTFEKLVAQARLQRRTLQIRIDSPEAPPSYEILPTLDGNGIAVGLAAMPAPDAQDVFFDIEGYPLMDRGLEYLFGVSYRDSGGSDLQFRDWWAHDREEEKTAFEGFVDWVYAKWRQHPGMHIYHYAAYEVSAVRRLSTRHDTRQDEVDNLLRNEVFIDLYKVVRRGLRIGEESYSIKKVEHLYRSGRATDVATAVDSIVQYAQWIESGQDRDWQHSSILKGIRDYNEDDCVSTAQLVDWLREVAEKAGIDPYQTPDPSDNEEERVIPPEAIARKETGDKLRKKDDATSLVLADLIDFHRREEKPVWWRLFDRAAATPEVLRDDAGCIEGIHAKGEPVVVKKSLAQTYRFDPSQECKLKAGDRSRVMFTHNTEMKLSLLEIDLSRGELSLKVSSRQLSEKSDGEFPEAGSLLPDEFISAKTIAVALTEVAGSHLSGDLPSPVAALLTRRPPAAEMLKEAESTLDAAVRITQKMDGGCLVIQGPPGTGKTYTASHVICKLLQAGKRVGVTSNSHKAVTNILGACGEAMLENKDKLIGIKVGGDDEDAVFAANTGLVHIKSSVEALDRYGEGIAGGTAWLFARPEWSGQLDYLFIDEAGQVSLANAVAVARCADNLVLLGDQMQLEQPIQGAHPGDAGMSVLQYALKDNAKSKPDAPVFHAVVPPESGLFLGESYRMHPDVCRFISDSIYEGGLRSHKSCSTQRIALPAEGGSLVNRETGIVFSAVEHEGNIQQSDEEVLRVQDIYGELKGRVYTDKAGHNRKLGLDDILFIAPYNAQVRALQERLPEGARVGSVDKFQGQEAAVCVLSLCSSFGEYGSRGLAFILDRNRINVAISRAQCLAVVVADPRIAGSPANSIGEMKLLNLFCKVLDGND